LTEQISYARPAGRRRTDALHVALAIDDFAEQAAHQRGVVDTTTRMGARVYRVLPSLPEQVDRAAAERGALRRGARASAQRGWTAPATTNALPLAGSMQTLRAQVSARPADHRDALGAEVVEHELRVAFTDVMLVIVAITAPPPDTLAPASSAAPRFNNWLIKIPSRRTVTPGAIPRPRAA
jgi:hypothetical protein